MLRKENYHDLFYVEDVVSKLGIEIKMEKRFQQIF